MTNVGDPSMEDTEQVSAYAETYSRAWELTVGDAERMAAGKAEDGWETVVLPAGDMAPEPPSDGKAGRYGLAYVVPGNRADTFERMLETATFPEWEVYRTTVEGRVFIVTELLDPEAEKAAYVAGNYELRLAEQLIETAAERGTVYTHLQRLDGTPVASFEHEDWRRFFPEPDSFLDGE
ncbi:MAG: DUF7529 family protein [Halodesulfurarchaeum sp.]